jgi:hypothetical protein
MKSQHGHSSLHILKTFYDLSLLFFMFFVDMIRNEIEVLIFGHGRYVFYTMLEYIFIYYWSD